jgi:hypothetical protein
MDTKDKTKTKLPMICVCKDAGKEVAAANRARFLDVWSDKHRETVEKNIVSNLTQCLWWDYNFSVEGIHCDMRFGVRVESEDERIWIECDTAEDGLIAIWCHLRDTRKSNGDIIED